MSATRSARLATSRSCSSVLASCVPKITGSFMSPPSCREPGTLPSGVVRSGGQIDEVLYHTDMTPRLVLRLGEPAHADRLLVVLVRVGADLAAETLEANRLESGRRLEAVPCRRRHVATSEVQHHRRL